MVSLQKKPHHPPNYKKTPLAAKTEHFSQNTFGILIVFLRTVSKTSSKDEAEN